MTLQGLPPAMQSSGIDFVTTLPAAITERAPIVTPLRIMQRVPTRTLSCMIICLDLAV